MFIQITKDKSIRQKDIIGIFDLDNATISGVTKSFLSRAEKNCGIIGINTLPKSFIVTDGRKENSGDFKIYFSSSMTGHIYKSERRL